MKSSLIEGRALTLRVVLCIVASIALMMTDYRFSYLETVRTYLLSLVYPIQYIVDLPVKASQWLSMSVASRIQLLEENARLQEVGERVQIAEILAVDLAPSKRKILINRGKSDDVFLDQPVIDAMGVMGQVIRVSAFSSIVMLITDPGHELPVQVVRTGLRTVAKGMGTVNRLSLLYIPNIGLNMSIKVGDLIVTSGFGKKFPKGYPVATVIEVIPDIGKPYAQVQSIPKAALERNREVLLLWKKNSH